MRKQPENCRFRFNSDVYQSNINQLMLFEKLRNMIIYLSPLHQNIVPASTEK